MLSLMSIAPFLHQLPARPAPFTARQLMMGVVMVTSTIALLGCAVMVRQGDRWWSKPRGKWPIAVAVLAVA